MKTLTLAVMAALTLATMGCNLQTTPGPDPDPGKPAGVSGKLVKFSSQAELNAYIEKVSEATKVSDASDGDSGEGDVMASAPEASSAEESSSGDNAEITNNQEAGVDEGGIVKNYKDMLVVLREGRLYTVRVGGEDGLAKRDEVDVAAKGLDTNVWYDEILVDDSKVIVIGYRYSILPAEGSWYKNSATEINLFDISDEGELTRGDTYFIESGDYYSWTNYSGRMVNGKFVLYMPYYTNYLWEKGQDVRMPSWYKYVDGVLVSQGHFFEPNHVVKPVQDTEWPTFHVVAVCSLESGMSCRSDVVLGSWNRTYYVSQDAAYLFLSQYYGYWLCGTVDVAALSAESGEEEEQETNLLYRLSLDGTSSGAVGIEGDPFDQFSLVERDNQVSVFISAYHPSTGTGRTYSYDQALVRIPLTDFSDDVVSLPAGRYLLMPDHDIYKVRFHQGRLVYSGTNHIGVVDTTSGNIATLDSPFYVTRIEPAGERVVLFGSDNWGWGDSLSMASVSLGSDDASPALGQEHTIPLYQGEWRSHGYAFHDGATTDHFGLATLEIREKDASEKDYYWDWYEYIPSVSYFTLSADGSITDAGRMTESEDLLSAETCTTSCVDWYGNTRPIFLEDQVIGLIGDQMAIGAWSEAGEVEVSGALNFTSGS